MLESLEKSKYDYRGNLITVPFRAWYRYKRFVL
jgi:hypothetical protein